ncbi:transmembrane protein 18-domain-containing protein [Gamsiella multidivaricata]|uniref:transmembrane protein 18-domain-containing protein n=1 Tax=Gamsiella multidivaricata TaxID=101098 RepID=UPI00222063EC|nr:transmembrane protein 18-domain-containing protein [Gamsiella multidivaricata]KAI7820303.1 transmembrane protein 18-domain-containing protein [Gamsiella multidivaricata]
MPAGSEGSSQFWSDFWNTLHQFTHPFSSTFFDSLFPDSGNSNQPEPQPLTQAQPTGTESRTAAGTGAGGTRHFKDEASFEKFWRGLQKGTYHHESNPNTPLEHVQAAWIDFKSATSGFISSIEWQQTWIQLILAMHLIIFIAIILLRNKPNPLAAMFFCIIVLTALSEPLNSIGSRHWQLFSDDNYFDAHGVFTSIVWAAPLLTNAILAVLLLLRTTVKMLVKVKREQLKDSKRKKQQ